MNAFFKACLNRPTTRGALKRVNPFSNTYNNTWKVHPNLKWSNKFDHNRRQGPTQNLEQRKPSQLEEILGQFMKSARNSLQELKLS